MSDGPKIAKYYMTTAGKTLLKTYHTKFKIGQRKNIYEGAEEYKNILNLVQ